MPETLVHFIIPFFLLIMFGFNLKKATLISLLAIVPDFDILFHIHRSLSHSIFFILAICIPAIIIAKKYYKEQYDDFIIATLVILSHPFMDSFTYFTPVFWPFFNKSIYILTELTTNMNDIFDLNLIFQVQLKPIIFYQTQDIDAHIFSSQGVAVSLVLLIGLALKHFSNKPPWSRL